MNDDRLSDSCWNSEKREVELWEKRDLVVDFVFRSSIPFFKSVFTGSDPASHSTSSTSRNATIPASAYAPTFSFPISSSSSLFPAGEVSRI
jgi:hypothetical protein